MLADQKERLGRGSFGFFFFFFFLILAKSSVLLSPHPENVIDPIKLYQRLDNVTRAIKITFIMVIGLRGVQFGL